jgi:hypothetical protein
MARASSTKSAAHETERLRSCKIQPLARACGLLDIGWKNQVASAPIYRARDSNYLPTPRWTSHLNTHALRIAWV